MADASGQGRSLRWTYPLYALRLPSGGVLHVPARAVDKEGEDAEVWMVPLFTTKERALALLLEKDRPKVQVWEIEDRGRFVAMLRTRPEGRWVVALDVTRQGVSEETMPAEEIIEQLDPRHTLLTFPVFVLRQDGAMLFLRGQHPTVGPMRVIPLFTNERLAREKMRVIGCTGEVHPVNGDDELARLLKPIAKPDLFVAIDPPVGESAARRVCHLPTPALLETYHREWRL